MGEALAEKDVVAVKESAKREDRKYRDNAIDGFRNGACLDLRVRLAVEVLVHGGLFDTLVRAAARGGEVTMADWEALPRTAALMALESASELLRLAEERGLVEDFPQAPDIGRGLKDHAKRQATFQLEGNREAQRQAADTLRTVRPAGPLVKPS